MKLAAFFGLLFACAIRLTAADVPAAPPDSYRLMTRDQLSISVYDEPELAVTAGIDASGLVRMPLLDDVNLVGLTVREAEKKLERLFVERELLKKPQVNVRIMAYAPREVRVLGPGVNNPGTIPFPPEIATMDIVEAITKAGGFRGIAKSREVVLTRRSTKGTEKIVLNVKRMIEDGAEHAVVLPGDEIFVDEKFI